MKKYIFKRALTSIMALLMLLGALPIGLLSSGARVEAQEAQRVLSSDSGEYTLTTAKDSTTVEEPSIKVNSSMPLAKLPGVEEVRISPQIENTSTLTRLPAAASTDTGLTVGPVQDVFQKVDITSDTAGLCKRTLSGELHLNWPSNPSFVDLVIIQDYSGSFSATIEEVGKAVQTIANQMQFGVDIDGQSPKDRLMFVGFQGHQGIALAGGKLVNVPDYSYGAKDYKVEATPLLIDLNSVTSYINSHYIEGYPQGATPTIDGMVLAKEKYLDYTKGNELYNQQSYKIGGEVRNRKTIYMLITDGVPNSAKYSNLPDSLKTSNDLYFYSFFMPGRVNMNLLDKQYWDYVNATYFFQSRTGQEKYTGPVYVSKQFPNFIYDQTRDKYYWVDKSKSPWKVTNEYLPGDTRTSYYWRNIVDPNSYIYDLDGRQTYQRESYQPLLAGMADISKGIQSSGGLKYTPTTVISAFWENLTYMTSNSGFSLYWKKMSKIAEAGLENVASPGYYVTSTDLSKFTNGVIDNFSKASQSLQEIEITFEKGVTPNVNDVALFAANGSKLDLVVDKNVKVLGSKLIIDMTNRPEGRYRISYTANEVQYKGEDYKAITETSFRFGNAQGGYDEYKMSNEAVNQLTKLNIMGNTRQDCDITIRKNVASSKEDYRNANIYKELDLRRQEFYFDTTYTFTDQVLEVNESLKLRDEVDERLEVLDVYIVTESGNRVESDDPTDDGWFDVISGATNSVGKSTLVAEMKNGVNDNDKVPPVTVTSVDPEIKGMKKTEVIYTLRPQPVTISGKTYPFGGYDKKTYVMVIKARIRDSVSDIQIEEMINTKKDGRSIGVPNKAELISDGSIVTSNEVRVVPPQLKEPEINKYIAKGTMNNPKDDWSRFEQNLGLEEKTYRYKIEINLPDDTSSYETLIISDELDDYLEFYPPTEAVPDRFKISYNAVGYSEISPAPQVSMKPIKNTAGEVVGFDVIMKTVTAPDGSVIPFPFNKLANGKIIVEFDVKIKDGVDLSKRYNGTYKDYRIDNTASYKLNTRDPKFSNTVQAIIPTPKLKLLKYTEKGDPSQRIPLEGVRFTLTDDGGIEPMRSFITDRSGQIIIDQLTPGKFYVLKEISTLPEYILNSSPFYVILDEKDNKISVSTDKSVNLDVETSSVSMGDGIVYFLDTNTIEFKNFKPETLVPSKTLHGELDNDPEFKAPPKDNPYILKQNGEEITYRITVPVGLTVGYNNLTVSDDFDDFLTLDEASAKSFYFEGEKRIDVTGEFTIDGLTNTLTWKKTSNFKEVEDKHLIIEVKAKVSPENVKKVFADINNDLHKEGKLANKAVVTLNNNPVWTNDTVIQLSKAKVSLQKTITPTGGTPQSLSNGLVATFQLYKVANPPTDGKKPVPDPDTDIKVPNGLLIISGSDSVSLDIYDTGWYYFVETSPPTGYVAPDNAAADNVPNQTLFEVKPGTVNDFGPYNIDNKESEQPTISKKQKMTKEHGLAEGDISTPKPYDKQTLDLLLGSEWMYAVDTYFPSNLDLSKDGNYIITDPVNKHFEILELKVLVGNSIEGPFIENPELLINLKSNVEWNNPNKLIIKLTNKEIEKLELRGKVVRIELKVKVKPGTNLLREGVIVDSVIPNTATLEFPGGKLESTVNVRPTIFRDLSFTKKLGDNTLTGAVFKLYPFDLGTGTPSAVPLKDAFGKEFVATSGPEGQVSFTNIPEGEYVLIETQFPKGTTPVSRSIRVTVAGATVPYGDPKGVILRGVNVNKDQQTGAYIVSNNECVEISGFKHWVDDNNLLAKRPEHVIVKVYRALKSSPENKELIDTKYVSEPWTYTFKDEESTDNPKFVKYHPSGEEYIYSVSEEPVPGYTQVDDPNISTYDLKNELDKVKLTLIKKDQFGKLIPNRPFKLITQNGLMRDLITNNEGQIIIDDLAKDSVYNLIEVLVPTDPYVVINEFFQIIVDANGNISISNADPAIDANNDKIENTFVITNIKMEDPVKKVGKKTDANKPDKDLYELTGDLHEVFTYSVKQSPIDYSKLNAFEFVDTVDPALAVVLNSGKVYAEQDDGTEKEVTEVFTKDLTNGSRTKSFKLYPSNPLFKARLNDFNNKTLRFVFDAYVAVSADKLKYLHPNLTIPNKGQVIFNNSPDMTFETNEVNVKVDVVDVMFTKLKADHTGENLFNFSDNEYAEFELYNAKTDEYIKTVQTAGGGELYISN